MPKKHSSKLRQAFAIAALISCSAFSAVEAATPEMEARLREQSARFNAAAVVKSPQRDTFFNDLTEGSMFSFFSDSYKEIRRLTLSEPLVIKTDDALRKIGLTPPGFIRNNPTELHLSTKSNGLNFKQVDAKITYRF